MITVKICDVGGYVTGDGDLPKGFNPDKFLIAFGKRVTEAQRAGLKELKFTDAEIDEYMAKAGQHIEESITNAPTLRLPNKALKKPELIPIGGLGE